MDELPNELICDILSFLHEGEHALTVSHVCTKWRQLSCCHSFDVAQWIGDDEKIMNTFIGLFFKSLFRCSLAQSTITDESLMRITKCVNLKELNVSGCKNISMNTLSTLLDNLPKIESLDISRLQHLASEESFSSTLTNKIALCQYLTKLNISKLPLNGIDLARILTSLRSLTSLTVCRIKFDRAEDLFAKALKEECLLLKHLDISNTYLDLDGRAIADAIKFNKSLTSLVANDCLSEEAVSILATSLYHNTTLQQLNIGRNSTWSDGTGIALDLAEMLKYNRTIQKLGLNGCKISPFGGLFIAKHAIEENSSLTSLNLSDNDLEDEGVCAIAEGLEKNASMMYINLSNNKMTSYGVISLAKVILHSQKLRIDVHEADDPSIKDFMVRMHRLSRGKVEKEKENEKIPDSTAVYEYLSAVSSRHQ